MKTVKRYALRLERKKYLVRGWRKSLPVHSVVDRTAQIKPRDVLCFSTLRNERVRLKYFLSYYRDRGVSTSSSSITTAMMAVANIWPSNPIVLFGPRLRATSVLALVWIG